MRFYVNKSGIYRTIANYEGDDIYIIESLEIVLLNPYENPYPPRTVLSNDDLSNLYRSYEEVLDRYAESCRQLPLPMFTEKFLWYEEALAYKNRTRINR